jgi:hypothetical protein
VVEDRVIKPGPVGLGMVVHTYSPSYSGGKGWKITVQGQLGEKHETVSEKAN